jgi:hypothetical protein
MSMRPLSTGEGNNDVPDLKRISNRKDAVKQTWFDKNRSRYPHEGQETLFGYFRSCLEKEADPVTYAKNPCANQQEEYGSLNSPLPLHDRIYDANQYEVSDSESTN